MADRGDGADLIAAGERERGAGDVVTGPAGTGGKAERCGEVY